MLIDVCRGNRIDFPVQLFQEGELIHVLDGGPWPLYAVLGLLGRARYELHDVYNWGVSCNS